MNKVFVKGIFATAIAAMALTSCSSDITEDVAGTVGELKHVTFKATSETPAGTRTSITGNLLKWNYDDMLTVWGMSGSEPASFTVTGTNDDETSAVIVGDITADEQYVAVYPGNAEVTKEFDNNNTYVLKGINIPQAQEATSMSFDFDNGCSSYCDENATPMVAVSEGENLLFKNVCAYAKIQLPNIDELIEIHSEIGTWIMETNEYFHKLYEACEHYKDLNPYCDYYNWEQLTLAQLGDFANTLRYDDRIRDDESFESFWDLSGDYNYHKGELLKYKNITITAGKFDDNFDGSYDNIICGKLNVTLNASGNIMAIAPDYEDPSGYNEITYDTNDKTGCHNIAIVPYNEEDPYTLLTELTIAVEVELNETDMTITKTAKSYTIEYYDEEDPEYGCYYDYVDNKLINIFKRNNVVNMGNINDWTWNIPTVG